jgi:hypothetical protein
VIGPLFGSVCVEENSVLSCHGNIMRQTDFGVKSDPLMGEYKELLK